MASTPINNVLARNLALFMERRDGMTQMELSVKSGVGQTTISLYLHPENRKPGANGKNPSAKLAEVEMLAKALGVQIWELLRDLTPEQRSAYEAIEKAFIALNPQIATTKQQKAA